ncbi:MAG: hypothetical protein ACKV22_29385 [Bryobacteraceae bacterium]
MSTEVYSWRLSTELKSSLEREARARKKSISAVLHLAVRDWLKQGATNAEEDEEQHRLHEAAVSCLGTIEGRNSRRAERGRQAIRERLRRRHAR